MNKFSAKPTYLLVLLCFALGFFQTAKADHVMGADMSYQCLGSGKYKLIIKFYRDCRGASAPPSWSLLYWYAGNNGSMGTSKAALSMSRVSIRDITPRCSTASNPCSPTNTSYTGEGVEEHTYETTIDISKSPFSGSGLGSTYCELTIAYNQCCRNAAITTGATWADFWTTAMINVCSLAKMNNKCNTSPNLTNVPVAYACCNQAYYFNNGALDTTDYDSLSYKLAPALAGVPNSSVTYTTPFSYQYPVTPYCVPPTTIKCTPNVKTNPPRGFLMDTSTGDIVFTPTKCDEVGILVLEISEWRKDTAGVYRIVGKTRRDIQIIVKDDCGYNKAPTIEGPQSNKVCEGDKICFSIYGKDETFTPYQTIPDTVQMTWNGGIPGATFKIKNPKDREKEAEFCWQTKLGQASDVAYAFTVKATDDHCPKPSQTIRGFKVKVNPRAFSIRKYTILKCGRFAFSASVSSTFKGTAQYKWSFRDSNGNNEFYFSSKKSDTMTFSKGGKFIVVHTVNNSDNCPTIYRDTVIIPPPPKVVTATKDTFACFNTSMKLVAQVYNAKLPYSYYWTRPVIHISGDTFQTITIPKIDRDSTMQVKVTDADGCKFFDTATIFVKPLPSVPGIADKRICTYQTATFDAQHADSMKYLWNTGDTTRQITQHIKGLYSVMISDTIYHCIIRDTAELFVNDSVVALAGADKMICTNDKYTISGNHRNAALTAIYQWSDLTAGSVLGANTSYQVQPKNTNGNGNSAKYFPYELYVKITQNGLTCEKRDTMVIKVNTLPVVTWTTNNLPARCYNYGNINLDAFVTSPKQTLWKPGNIRMWGVLTKYGPTGLVDSLDYNFHKFETNKINNLTELQNGKNVTETITLWFKDTNGCINTANTTQKINGNPIILLDTMTYCQDLGSASLDKSVVKPKVKFGTQQTWEVISVPSGVNPSNVLVDNSGSGTDWWLKFGTVTEDFYSGTYKMKFSVTDILTTCFSVDTTLVYIVTEPKVAVTAPNQVCANWDTLDLRNNVLLNNAKPVINGLADTMNYFTITNVGGNYADPRCGKKLVNGYQFPPSWGFGDYQIKFSSKATGCLKEDSFNLTVNPVPTSTVTNAITLCEGTLLDLSKHVLTTSPTGGIETWAGQWVNNGFFTANSNSSANTIEGPYKLRFDYKIASTGCTDTQYLNVSVRNLPKVVITNTKPASGCENSKFAVQSSPKYADKGVQWTTINASDGTFDNANANNISYTHGAGDKAQHFAWVKVSTLPITNEVCPQAADSIQILLYPYPVVDFTSPVAQCAPLTADFIGIETSGIPAGQLAWHWDFGNGDTSAVQNPTGILYKNQGKYPVSLTVTNTMGPCPTNLTRTDYVLAYPKPVAGFTTDPAFKTTIALPKFRMFNTSTLDKSVFPGGFLKYHWDFGDPIVDPNDTSTLTEPRWAYGKDTNTYKITLIAKSDFGCADTLTQMVVVGPDIIIYIPDIFTPEGTGPGRNETFMISVQNYKSMDMTIYNRWGEKLYETKDPTKGWNGKSQNTECPQGVYVYELKVIGQDDHEYKFKGSITLLR